MILTTNNNLTNLTSMKYDRFFNRNAARIIEMQKMQQSAWKHIIPNLSSKLWFFENRYLPVIMDLLKLLENC